MAKDQSNKTLSCLGLIAMFAVGFVMMDSCEGNSRSYPFQDSSIDEEAEIDYLEGKLESEQYPDYNPGANYDVSELDTPDESGDLSGGDCPGGCAFHQSGCDIKGNISMDTGEKIFHVPGQMWYQKTTITPDDGERWFCSEDDAEAAGWRKSYE